MSHWEAPHAATVEASVCPLWEHFAHEADIGIRGYGATQDQSFERAAIALIAVMTDPSTIRGETRVEIVSHLQAPSREILLYDWLNAVIYQMVTRHMLFARFVVQTTSDGLTGIALGEPIDELRHEPAVEIKGATMTCLAVEQVNSGLYMAQCVVDI